jgi:uncharacterized protein (TIGR01777 family)
MASVLLSGGSGLIGGALKSSLGTRGRRVVQLTRRDPASPDEVRWDSSPAASLPDIARLECCTAAVHLSGANLAAGRWSESYKQTIAASRVDSTRQLLRILGALRNPPGVLVMASGVGIYGDRGDEVLTEASTLGQGFLPEVCAAWESAAEPVRELGIRLVQLRFGVVLTPKGGALQKMLPVFRVGLGGKLGDGGQWMSWISLEDAVRAILFALGESSLNGACNTTAPEPLTNAEFTRVLGRRLHRPALLRVPAFALRAAFGQMAEDTVLASTRAVPWALQNAGFRFQHPQLETALAAML